MKLIVTKLKIFKKRLNVTDLFVNENFRQLIEDVTKNSNNNFNSDCSNNNYVKYAVASVFQYGKK